MPEGTFLSAWIPGASFKRHVETDAQKVRDLRDIPFKGVKASMVHQFSRASPNCHILTFVQANGSAQRSFVSDNLEKTTSVSKEDEEIVRNCAAIVYLGILPLLSSRVSFPNLFNLAGSDSVRPRRKVLQDELADEICFTLQTVALITAWVLAMAHYPEIQKRAQEEIDQITGGVKLPEHNDIDTLPYLQAVLLETLRWHSVAPLGMPRFSSRWIDTHKDILALPHQAVCEDEYSGYRIPAGKNHVYFQFATNFLPFTGATITVNAW